MKALIVGCTSKFSSNMAAILEDDGCEVVAIEWAPRYWDSDPRYCNRLRREFVETTLRAALFRIQPIDVFIYSQFDAFDEERPWVVSPATFLSHVIQMTCRLKLFVSIASTEACATKPFTPSTLNGSSGRIGKILVVGIAPIAEYRPWIANPGPRRYWKEEDGRWIEKIDTVTPVSPNRTPIDLYWAAEKVIRWSREDFAYKAANITWDPPSINVVEQF